MMWLVTIPKPLPTTKPLHVERKFWGALTLYQILLPLICGVAYHLSQCGDHIEVVIESS